MARARADHAWVGPARGLYLVSMAVFLVTIAIGILNGLDLVEFSHDVLLTHVHSGTLGWITLGIVATAFWIFRAADRRLAITLAVLTPVYIAAFLSGSFEARAITGVLILGAVLWLLVWAWRTYLRSDRSLPQLAVVLGLTTFAYGAVIGVVLQVQFALKASWLTGDAIGAHAGAMVFAYLVLVAMGVIEWRVLRTTGLPRSGVAEILSLFVGGLILSAGLLLGAAQIAGGLYLVSTIVAFLLFLGRVFPSAVQIRWTAGGAPAQIGAAAIWVVVSVAIYLYLVAQFVAANGDISVVDTNILVASDHATFIGVLTNLLFALTATLSGMERRRPRWVETVVFEGLNLGLFVFVVGLVANTPEIKRIGSSVMGLAILVGLVFLALDTWASRSSEAAPD